jgi:hypothetical protein
MLAIPGIVLAVRDRVGALNAYFAILAACYLALFVARDDWEGGWTPPGRFILVLLPLFAFYVGYLLDRPNRFLAWPVFWILGAVGTAYNLVSLQSPNHGFSAGVGQNQTITYAQQLVPHLSLTRYLPSTVKGMDYELVTVWVFIVAAICGLVLLKLPLEERRLPSPANDRGALP